MNIILCGFKNSGKTTLGQAYSQCYQIPFVDTDDLICQQNNHQGEIRTLYQHLGKAKFRQQEQLAIKSIEPTVCSIIATGGGSLDCPDNTQHLQQLGAIIYLYANTKTLQHRMQQQPHLPAFIHTNSFYQDFTRLFKQRSQRYTQLADYTIDTCNKSINTLVDLLHKYRENHGK